MIVGIGTDLVTIARIEKILARFPTRFAGRILAPGEQAAYQATRQPARFLAKRFAVKEAAAKALGYGLRHGIQFKDFALSNTPLGQPILALEGKAGKVAQMLGVHRLHVSVSDEEGQALAFVLLEG